MKPLNEWAFGLNHFSWDFRWPAYQHGSLEKSSCIDRNYSPEFKYIIQLKWLKLNTTISGDKGIKGRDGLRSNTEVETRKEDNVNKTRKGEKGDKMEDGASPAALSNLRIVVSEVVTECMRELKSEMKTELTQNRLSSRDDMKGQLDELRTEINQQVKTATGQIEVVAKRVGEMEKKMAGKETWDIGVKDTLIQLLNNHKSLQARGVTWAGPGEWQRLRYAPVLRRQLTTIEL